MQFTILGMGKTGHAVACYLLEKGYQVKVWDRSSVRMNSLKAYGITISGQITGHFAIEVEREMGKAILNSKYLLVMTTGNGHRDVARLLQGHLQENQRILIFNSNWGALEFYQILKDEVIAKKVIIAETGAQLFAASLEEPEKCYLKSIKSKVSAASIPSKRIEILLEELKTIFPQLTKEENVIATSMNSSNPIVHCPLNLFNLARIDSGEELLMFASEYTSPMGVKYIEEIDKERINVMSAMGVSSKSLLHIFNESWNSDYVDIYTALKSIKSYQTAKIPKSFLFRHFTEDIPFGIMPIQKLARIYCIKTPYLDAMIQLYELILNKELRGLSPDFTKINLDELII